MAHQYDPQLDAFELYHKAIEENAKTSILGGPALPALGHAISGAAGSAISTVLTYPLSLVVTRLQVQRQYRKQNSRKTKNNDDYDGIFDAFEKIYTQEGEGAFYTGCAQDVAKTVLDSFLFFLAYNYVKESRLKKAGTKRLPVYEELAVGMFAGAFGRFFTSPVGNIVTRKQTAAMAAAQADTEIRELSVAEIASQIKKEKGIAGFWSGYSATLVLTLNPALTFLLHETLLRVLVARERRSNPGPRVTFLLAALSKAVASAVTYPFSLAKSRAQVSSQPPMETDTEEVKEEDSKQETVKKEAKRMEQKTVFDMIVKIAKEEGFFALYSGLEGEMLKGFISHGLTMLLKERIHKIVIQTYYFILKALRRYPSPQEIAKATASSAAKTASNAGEKAAEVVKEGAAKVQQAASIGQKTAQNASGKSQELLDNAVETMQHLYLEGKENLMDIVDEYIDTDDVE